MTGIFSGLKSEGLEEAQDRLGGFSLPDTDAYEATIKLAYAGQSAGGAMNVTVVAELDGGREYRETVYVTNKKGENFFLNQHDPTKKVPLPGFTVIDDLCLVTTEKPLADQTSEEKIVNVYDPEQRKEMPKSVPVLVDLIGKKAYLGIVQQTVNKNEKNGAGEYVPTADTRNETFIEKVFHFPTKMTTVEAKNGATEPTFFDKWVEKNRGVTRDKRKIKDEAGTAGRPTRSAPASAPQAGQAAPRTSLFGAKQDA